MAGPAHGILGDDAGYGLDLPESQGVTLDADTANMGRFSQSREFQALKAKIESRIDYYRTYQPGGSGQDIPLRDLPNDERGWRSLASDLVITEFRALITAYEIAAEEVKNAAPRQKRP